MNSWIDWAILGGIIYLIILFAFLFVWKRFWDLRHEQDQIINEQRREHYGIETQEDV